MKHWIACIKNTFHFKGRCGRREYWTFLLFTALFAIGLAVIDHFLGLAPQGELGGTVCGVFLLLMLLPIISASFRRFHDVRIPGFIALLPFAFVLIFMIIIYLPMDTNLINHFATILPLPSVGVFVYCIVMLAQKSVYGNSTKECEKGNRIK